MEIAEGKIRDSHRSVAEWNTLAEPKGQSAMLLYTASLIILSYVTVIRFLLTIDGLNEGH